MALFSEQYAVCGTDQLVALGISRPAISRALEQGLIEQLSVGVVGLCGFCGGFESRAMALHLSAHRRGFLSGITAGRIHGLRSMHAERIEYTVDAGFEMKVPAWAILKRTSWPDEAPRLERLDSLCVASPLRMLFELASRLSERRFRHAAEDAWHLGLVNPVEMGEYLAEIRRRGRGGVRVFEEWLTAAAQYRSPAQSGLEQFVAEVAVEAGLDEPQRQFPLQLRSGVTIHLDLAWPDLRLAIEPGHTWWHGGNEQMAADQARDRQCAELGWMIVRFDESVRNRREEAGRQLRTIASERRTLFAV